MTEEEENKELEKAPQKVKREFKEFTEAVKGNESPSGSVRKEFRDFIKSITNYFANILDLKEGLDRWGTVQSIRDGIYLKGSNIWLLISAIAIASIGLDVSSPALLIGAMLISPLMSSILGIGLSIGINDRKTLFGSLKSFGTATVVSLITSALYFSMSPIGTATPEMLSRTSPTALDVIVAFFGGIAGIVAGSRKDKSAAIPGVAIATALLPPLCVAGFGIAHGDFKIFIGSFYLFFLNTVFISLATYVIVRLLKFPYKEHLSPLDKKKAQWAITAFVLIIMIPSITGLINLAKDGTERRFLKGVVTEEFQNDRNQLIKWEVISRDSINELNVLSSGDFIPLDSIQIIQEKLVGKTRKPTILNVMQTDIPPDELDERDEALKAELMKFYQLSEKAREQTQLKLDSLNQTIQTIKSDTLPVFQMAKEIKALYPKANEVGFSRSSFLDKNNKIQEIPLVLINWDRSVTRTQRGIDQKKINEFLLLRFELDTLKIMNY